MKTRRTTLKRLPARGAHDVETIHAILDEALICHLGFSVDEQPYVIPTIHARRGATLYLHGAVANRMLGSIVDWSAESRNRNRE
jgi:nitroimidazol reductase NimA-like FMN-containing flavoprotein (pyridoxamine 5'-phosphate oxidase superfamily)